MYVSCCWLVCGSVSDDETLFSVLISVDFDAFPANVRRFLSYLRCAVVDHYIRDDLTYFMSKGKKGVALGVLERFFTSRHHLRVTQGALPWTLN